MIGWRIRFLSRTRLSTVLCHKLVRRLLALVQLFLVVYFVAMAYLFLWLGGSVARFESDTRSLAWSTASGVFFVVGVCVLVSGIVAFWLEPAKLPRARRWMLLACAVGHSGAVLLLIASFGLSLVVGGPGQKAAANIAWYLIALCLLLPSGLSALVQMAGARDGARLSPGRSACDS